MHNPRRKDLFSFQLIILATVSVLYLNTSFPVWKNLKSYFCDWVTAVEWIYIKYQSRSLSFMFATGWCEMNAGILVYLKLSQVSTISILDKMRAATFRYMDHMWLKGELWLLLLTRTEARKTWGQKVWPFMNIQFIIIKHFNHSSKHNICSDQFISNLKSHHFNP